jgi:hypothetical protein
MFQRQRREALLNKTIVVVALLLSAIDLCAYVFPFGSYWFWNKVALIGAPGLVVAVVVSSALRGGEGTEADH